MTLPEGTRGNLVAVGLVLIPVLLVFTYVLAPLARAYTGINEEIASLQDDIARYQRIIAQLPALEAAASDASQAQPLAPFVLAGQNEALAAAGLQQHLQRVAAASGVRILSLRVQTPVNTGPFQGIPVEVRMHTDTAGLRNLLFGLETGNPYVVIDALNIAASPARRRSQPAADRLDVRFILSGLRLPGGAADGSAGNG
jgi:general secretion pathway protein M